LLPRIDRADLRRMSEVIPLRASALGDCAELASSMVSEERVDRGDIAGGIERFFRDALGSFKGRGGVRPLGREYPLLTSLLGNRAKAAFGILPEEGV
jgi:hypothetical protein